MIWRALWGTKNRRIYASGDTGIAVNSKPPKNAEKSLTAEIKPGGRATSYDVARHAGVSQSAVSRCFKSGASVSKKMRARVMNAVEELGYRPNAIARGLITQRSNMIAVVIANLSYYPDVLVSLSRSLDNHGLNMLLFSVAHESDAEYAIEQIGQYQVGGVIAAANLPREKIEVLIRANIPLVFINRSYQDLPVCSVSCDHAAGERTLVDLLVREGYKSFGIIAGPLDSVVSRQRTTGAIDRLHELGFTEHQVVYGNLDYESGGSALRELYESRGNKMPDAVICANDMMAIGCVDEARNHYNLRVPEDLAVVGYDGAAQASWLNYRLVTIQQPLEKMTEAAISMIMERMEIPDQPPERRVFSGSLIQGNSVR